MRSPIPRKRMRRGRRDNDARPSVSVVLCSKQGWSNISDYGWSMIQKTILQLCFSCSISSASVKGSEWKLPWEGTVNHQSRAFRVASAHSPELLQLLNMLCLYFPAPLICQSNDSANSLRILVFLSRICQARLLVSLAIQVLAETQNGKKKNFPFLFF